jgi:hypothetical protein
MRQVSLEASFGAATGHIHTHTLLKKGEHARPRVRRWKGKKAGISTCRNC